MKKIRARKIPRVQQEPQEAGAGKEGTDHTSVTESRRHGGGINGVRKMLEGRNGGNRKKEPGEKRSTA